MPAVIFKGSKVKALKASLELGTLTLVGPSTTDKSLNLPDANDTLVGRDTTDTLTNKTLTAPTINQGTIQDTLNLYLRDTSASFSVNIKPTSSPALTDTRILSLDMQDANRIISLAGNLTVSGNATVNNSNTGDITLAAVGSAPNGNAASLSGQQLTLQPADGSNPGLLSAGAQTIGGAKTFNDAITAKTSIILEDPGAGSNTVTIQSGAVLSSYAITLPTAAPSSNGQALTASTGGTASWTTVASASTGDIAETSFSLADNQAVAADVTGLVFNNASVRSAQVHYSIVVDAATDLFEAGTLLLIQKGASWEMSRTSVGDNSLVELTVNNSGQVQFTTPSYAGFSSATMKFRAISTGV